MAQSKEYYRAQPIDVDGAYKIGGVHMSGFLVKTDGSLTVTDADGTVLVNAQPLLAAVATWVRIPLMFKTQAGGTVTLAGGASGTLFI